MNGVFVDFKIGDKSAFVAADTLPAKLAQSGDAAGKAFAASFDRQASLAEAQNYAKREAALRASSVRKLAIYRADTANEIRIEQEAADKIARIRGAGSQRANAAGRLNLARQGADVFTQLGSGQGLGLVAIQQGPQILDAMALSGFKLSTALAASAASITIVAAGAAVVYKITTDIAEAEKQKLRFIENGAIASNKILLTLKAQTDEFVKQRAAAQFNRDLQKDLANDSAADLERKIKLNQELIRLTPLSPNNPQRQQTILEAEAQLDKVRTENAKKLDDTFAQRHATYIARQKAEFQQEQERAAKAIEKAKELNKVTQDFFQSLSQRTNADNPFFKILSDAQELEKQIAKLDPAFRSLARTQASIATANSLFGAKLDSALSVSDLRQQASQFRNGQKGETSDDLLKRLGFNPAQFNNLTDAQKANFATNFGANQAVQLANASRGGNLGGVNIADLAIGAFKNAQQRQSTEETAQQRLDRQFKELSKLSPTDELQRASLDRKIASLAQGIDPTTLRQDTRNQVADAIDRNANNVARQYSDATKATQDLTATINRLNANFEKQFNGGGSNSLEIVVNNKSDNVDIGVTPQPRNPSPADVANLYPQEPSSFFSGQ